MIMPERWVGKKMTSETARPNREALNAYYKFLLKKNQIETAHLHTYTAVVVFGSYGALLSVWWGLRGIVSVETTAWAAALVMISVLSFVGHELWRVWREGNNQADISSALSQPTLDAFYDEINKFQKQEERRYGRYFPWWQASFLISVIFGVGGGLVLVCGVMSEFGWAFWTTAWWISLLGS